MLQALARRYHDAYAGLPRDVWVLALVLFVNRTGTMVLPFLMPYLNMQLGMEEGAAGQMLSLYGVGLITGAYVGARLVDRLGAIRLQTICMFLMVPSYIVVPFCTKWYTIGAALFWLSAVSACIFPANTTALTRLTNPDDRTRAFALQRLASNLGLSVGPALGGVLASIGYRLLFFVEAFTTLLAALVLLSMFRLRRLPSERKHNPSLIPGVQPLADKQFLFFLLLMLGPFIVFFQLITTFSLYLIEEYEFDPYVVGMIFAVNTLTIVTVEMLLVNYVKSWPLTRTIGWGSFLLCAGFGLLPLGSTVMFGILCMLIFTLGEMLSLPLAAGYVANRSPVGGEGKYMGWYTFVFAVGSVLGPLVGAFAYEFHPDAVWWGSLAIGFVVLGGFYLLPEPPPHQATGGDNQAEEPPPHEPAADEVTLGPTGQVPPTLPVGQNELSPRNFVDQPKVGD